MTVALEGGERSAARPSCTLLLGETRYSFYRRLGGPQGRSGWAENLVPTGIRSRTVQPVVSHYTDWATRPTYSQRRSVKSQKKKYFRSRTCFVWSLRVIVWNCVMLQCWLLVLLLFVIFGLCFIYKVGMLVVWLLVCYHYLYGGLNHLFLPGVSPV